MPICPSCHKRIEDTSIDPTKDSLSCPNCGRELSYREIYIIPDIFFIRLWYFLPKWLRILLTIVFPIILFCFSPIFVQLFQENIIFFLVIWILIPAILSFFYLIKLYRIFDYYWARVLRIISVTIVTIISFLIFGLCSTDAIDCGTSSLFDNPLGWIWSIVLIILIFSMPIICWNIGTMFIKKLIKRKEYYKIS